MDATQIVCALKDVTWFLGVFPSAILPPPSVTEAATLIVNTDPHTSRGSHWLAIRLQPRSYPVYFCNSYGLLPLIPKITDFLRRTCTVWNYNSTQLQGLNSSVCGKFCCLFAPYMDRGYSPKRFVGLFDPAIADGQIDRFFVSDFGPVHARTLGGGQRCFPIKGNYRDVSGSIRVLSLVWCAYVEVVVDYEYLTGS